MPIRVDLPAPLGPSRAKKSPGSTAGRDALQRLHAVVVGLAQVGDLRGRGSSMAAGPGVRRRRETAVSMSRRVPSLYGLRHCPDPRVANHFPLRLIDSRMLAPSVRHLDFARTTGSRWISSRASSSRCTSTMPDGTPTKRSYSLATMHDHALGPGEAVEIAVSYVAGGAATRLVHGARRRPADPGQRPLRPLLPACRRQQPALPADRHRHRRHALPGDAAATGAA